MAGELFCCDRQLPFHIWVNAADVVDGADLLQLYLARASGWEHHIETPVRCGRCMFDVILIDPFQRVTDMEILMRGVKGVILYVDLAHTR